MFYSIVLCLVLSGSAMVMGSRCPPIYRPVCGSDGITYSNFCLLSVAASMSGVKLTVAYGGRCKPKEVVCDYSHHMCYKPVCGSNGKTYHNECFLKAANCQFNVKLTVLHKGRCLESDSPCPKIYKPVCGNNGETYDNECWLDFVDHHSDADISLVHQGICIPHRVPKCYYVGYMYTAPVCGSDGLSYPSECMLRAASCHAETKITVAHEGRCTRS